MIYLVLYLLGCMFTWMLICVLSRLSHIKYNHRARCIQIKHLFIPIEGCGEYVDIYICVCLFSIFWPLTLICMLVYRIWLFLCTVYKGNIYMNSVHDRLIEICNISLWCKGEKK